jgi:hypothetical protein
MCMPTLIDDVCKVKPITASPSDNGNRTLEGAQGSLSRVEEVKKRVGQE